MTRQEEKEWEMDNNPESVQINHPYLGHIRVETELLIFPLEYANGDLNRELRKLAIEQGSFKPAPKN